MWYYLDPGQLNVVRYKPGETVTHEEHHHVPSKAHTHAHRDQYSFSGWCPSDKCLIYFLVIEAKEQKTPSQPMTSSLCGQRCTWTRNERPSRWWDWRGSIRKQAQARCREACWSSASSTCRHKTWLISAALRIQVKEGIQNYELWSNSYNHPLVKSPRP